MSLVDPDEYYKLSNRDYTDLMRKYIMKEGGVDMNEFNNTIDKLLGDT